jgi:penicillin-binding protein 2B
MGVPSSKQTPSKIVEKESIKITVPDFHDLALDAAKDTAKQFGVKAETLGKGPKVLGQFPKAGTEIGPSQRIYLVMQQMEEVSLPNLTGKSLRDAMEVCSFLHANCQVSGQGYVTDQSVSGEGENRVITLQLKPLSQTMDTSTNAQASKDSKEASKDSKAVAVDPTKAVSALSKSKQ